MHCTPHVTLAFASVEHIMHDVHNDKGCKVGKGKVKIGKVKPWQLETCPSSVQLEIPTHNTSRVDIIPKYCTPSTGDRNQESKSIDIIESIATMKLRNQYELDGYGTPYLKGWL